MRRIRAGIVMAILALTFSLTCSASADVQPCPNAHVATQQEADAASPKGSIIAGYTMVCPADAALGINNDAGAAKDYLKSVLCPPDGDNYGGYGPDETIRRLDAKFAQCAASMLKSLNSNGSAYCIREGARTVAKQNEYVARGVIACSRGAMCEHPRGIAIDINSTTGNKNACSSYTRAHQLAPQFGLTFYMGCKDAYHVVPQKSGCSAGGTAPDGGFIPSSSNPNAPLPASYYDYPQFAPAAAASSPFSTALNALAPAIMQATQATQPTPTQPAQPSPSLYPQGYTAPQQTESATNTASNTYIPTTGTTTSGNSSQVDIDRLAAIANGGNTSGSTGSSVSIGSSGSSGSSATGQSYQTSTSGPTQLNNDLTDAVNLGENDAGDTVIRDNAGNIRIIHRQVDGTLAINDLQGNRIDTLPSNTSVDIPPVHVANTFGTDAPPAQATSGLSAAQGKSLIVALLTTLRDLLLSYVNFLKSHSTFGFQGAWQNAREHTRLPLT